MPLPTTRDRVRPRALFIDKITINYQYSLNRSISLDNYRLACRAEHLRFVERVSAHTRSFTLTGILYDDAQFEFDIQMRLAASHDALNIYVSFSPLTYLHPVYPPSICEVSRQGARARNFVSPDMSLREKRRIIPDTYGLITNIERSLYQFTAQLETHWRGIRCELNTMTLQYMEMTYDVAADDPDALVERLTMPVRRRFRNVLHHHYQSSVSVSGVETDALMVSGFRAEGERYKAYSKTNLRVRLECALNMGAIAQILLDATGSRSIQITGEDQFYAMVRLFADHVAPQFQAVLSEVTNGAATGRSAFEFVAIVAATIRRPDMLWDVLLVLVRNQSITSELDRHVVRNLTSRGVLQPSDRRGLYHLTPQFIPAAEFLRTHPEYLLPFLYGLVRRAHHIVPLSYVVGLSLSEIWPPSLLRRRRKQPPNPRVSPGSPLPIDREHAGRPRRARSCD